MHIKASVFSYMGCLMCLFLLNGCSNENYPPVEIMGSRFYIVNLDSDQNRSFSDTKIVPLNEGQKYGWLLALRTNKNSVRYTQEITLADAVNWDIQGEEYHISPDQKSVTVDRTKSLYKGTIGGTWGVSKGDPPGKGTIKVIIEGKVAHIFEFELAKAN